MISHLLDLGLLPFDFSDPHPKEGSDQLPEQGRAVLLDGSRDRVSNSCPSKPSWDAESSVMK